VYFWALPIYLPRDAAIPAGDQAALARRVDRSRPNLAERPRTARSVSSVRVSDGARRGLAVLPCLISRRTGPIYPLARLAERQDRSDDQRDRRPDQAQAREEATPDSLVADALERNRPTMCARLINANAVAIKIVSAARRD
jgi:hypothetical protein